MLEASALGTVADDLLCPALHGQWLLMDPKLQFLRGLAGESLIACLIVP